MKKLVFSILLLAFVAQSSMADDLSRSSKRGFGESSLSYAEDVYALAKGCSWWYNWGSTPPQGLASMMGADNTIEFVPMAWNGGYDINTLRSYYQAHPQDKYLLGFNEPNFRSQANMTPAQAAEKWPALEQLAEELDLYLVAPALNYPDGAINDGNTYQPEAWMDGFIAAYKQRYNKDPRIDYLALHCYMDSPTAMLSFVENFAKKYGKQVWLTEFCSWESEGITPESQQQQMIQKVASLEKSEYVFRYAWFKARGSNAYPFYNLLEYVNRAKGIPAGTLSPLGFAYVNMSPFDTEKYYQVGEVIPVNGFVDVNTLPSIRKGIDPLTRDSIELYMQGNSVSMTYQVEVDEAGDYQILLRGVRPEGTNLVPRVNIIDAEGNVLASKIELTPTEDANTYTGYAINVTLPAGKQTLTIKKDNARAFCLSLIKLVRSTNGDADMATVEGTPISTGGGTEPDPGDVGENSSTDEGITITDVTTPKENPFQFSDDYRYYGIYVDGATREANMPDDRYLNCGDNGGSQNSWNWDGTFIYDDADGENSFGVVGGYIALTVGTQGWSGLGYNVNSTQGDLDLSCLNKDFKLHLAVKTYSKASLDFIINDGVGHAAHIVLGDAPFESDGAFHQPVANFKRDGKWHSIDVTMEYLQRNFGLDFRNDTDYEGNLFVILAGGDPTTSLGYDAVFFYGPKDAQPDTEEGSFDIKVTKIENPKDNPFEFQADYRYYSIYMDSQTLSRAQVGDVREVGPNGTNRNLYAWENTISFPVVAGPNSFGVEDAYITAQVGNVGWSGMGYNVAPSGEPLNLTGIANNYTLHLAVKSTYTGPIEFVLIDGRGTEAQIVLGQTAYDGHAPLADFDRDGTWSSIDIPLALLRATFGLDFSTSSNFTGNLLNILLGGVAGTQVSYDAVFIYGPASAYELPPEENIDERSITISSASQEPFAFPNGDYYVIYLDDETQAQYLQDSFVMNIGPNGSTQNLYPWENTFSFLDPTDANSFGVNGKYMLAEVGNAGWSGLGYNIGGSGIDLSAIDSKYTLHFAVKTTYTGNIEFYVVDGNGKVAYLPLGTGLYENRPCIGDIARDGTWSNIDVPVSWLVRQGLDYRTARRFTGNIFVLLAGGVAGTQVGYDAVFFYGEKTTPEVPTGIECINPLQQPTTLLGIYDLRGNRVDNGQDSMLNRQLPAGVYIVRTADGVRKIVVR